MIMKTINPLGRTKVFGVSSANKGDKMQAGLILCQLGERQ